MLDEHGVLLPGLRLVLHVPSTHTVNPRLSETQVAFHPCSLAARRGVRELNSPRPTSTNPRATSGERQLELPRLIVPLLTAAVAVRRHAKAVVHRQLHAGNDKRNQHDRE